MKIILGFDSKSWCFKKPLLSDIFMWLGHFPSKGIGWCVSIRSSPYSDSAWYNKLWVCTWDTDCLTLNTLRPRQDVRHFQDDILKWIFLNENLWISIKISLKFVPRGPVNNIPTLVQIMAWRRPGNKPLSEPMMDSLPTHICITWSQSVKHQCISSQNRDHHQITPPWISSS